MIMDVKAPVRVRSIPILAVVVFFFSVRGKRRGDQENSQCGEGEEGETGGCDGHGSKFGVVLAIGGAVRGQRDEVGRDTQDDDREDNARAWTEVSSRKEREVKSLTPESKTDCAEDGHGEERERGMES